MGRPPACCDKLINVKKGTWTEEEDANIVAHHGSKNGIGNWTSVPKKAGLNWRLHLLLVRNFFRVWIK